MMRIKGWRSSLRGALVVAMATIGAAFVPAVVSGER